MTTVDDFAAWPFSRIASVPRLPISEDPARQRSQLFPAAVDSHASGRPFVVVWLRPGPGSPVEVFISSPGPAPAVDGPLLYPPGSRGRPVAGSELVAKLSSLPAWIPCLGSADQLATEQQGPARGAPGTFEDYVSYLHREVFAWAVIGRPRRRAALVDDLRRLRLEIPALRDASGNSEQARLECERAEARYRELSGARASGSWDISVLAAALDPARARRVASLLCSATDLVGLPYVLLPAADDAAAFTDALERVASSEDGGCSPFLGTTAALVALAHPPETELPGVRVATSPAFDVTPEVWEPSPTVPDGIPRSQDGAIVVGSVLDHDLRPSSELELSHATLNRHTFVCGATGSGKSQTVRTLLEGLTGAGVPWLVIEPAKAEYALGMAARLGLGNVLVIRPGDPSLIASGLNPLEPAQGFPLQSHVDLVRALFMAAFQAEEPFPQILSQALTRCYDDCGWDLVSGQPRVEWAAKRNLAEVSIVDAVAGNGRGGRDRHRLQRQGRQRHARVCRCSHRQPALRQSRTVLRGRPSPRRRSTPEAERRPRDREHQQRRGQGICDRHRPGPVGRAPAGSHPKSTAPRPAIHRFGM